jgi:hypothetical protein
MEETISYTDPVTCPCCLQEFKVNSSIPTAEEYAEVLKKRRIAKYNFSVHINNLAVVGFTQRQIARILSCSQGNVSKILASIPKE